MDKCKRRSSDILGALSLGDATKSGGQFQSLISLSDRSINHSRSHDMINFYDDQSPHPLFQTQPMRAINLNGFTAPSIRTGCLVTTSAADAGGGHVEDKSCRSICAGSEASSDDCQRPRSQSVELALEPEPFSEKTSRSQDSLASCGSSVDEYASTRKEGNSEEALVELTCSKFRNLSTRGCESPSPVNQQLGEGTQLIRQQRCTPPFGDDVQRKYSIGSQPISTKRQQQTLQCPSSLPTLPVDLRCKRKKSDATSTSLSSLSIQDERACNAETLEENRLTTLLDHHHLHHHHHYHEDCSIGEEDQSILKSVLVGVGRKRSHTFSVLSRQDFRNSSQGLGVTAAAAAAAARQRVTLAKRNLGPVLGRVSEHLNRITQFLRSLPDFLRLSRGDQRSLITDSVHRLLMLSMAESNLQFVVTPMRDADDESSTKDSAGVSEEPTMQFTETVQNFISKCQTMNISATEYFYMRLITLFHTGSVVLENVGAVERSKAEAQQNLQSLVHCCYPDDRLRYSKLLLSLYTLFGINCHLLEALFCRHLFPNEPVGLQQFIVAEFMANGAHDGDGDDDNSSC